MSDITAIINFNNANSRETYFTMHHVKEAHKYGKGKNVKVGIIDWCFGLKNHGELYENGVDVSGTPFFLNECAEHGFWMAQVLKEIAPECKIYAINYLNGRNFDDRAKCIVKAIEWAIENGIQILTYSSSAFNEKERLVIDEAVNKAVNSRIITTFIHYDNVNNFYPGPLFNFTVGNRKPDIRILHYNYNTLFLKKYEKFILTDIKDIKGGDDIPYFSISSLSPVLAGFIAILKSIDDSLTLAECKEVLVKTSYSTHFKGLAEWENTDINNVADIGKAARQIYNSAK